MNDQARQQRAGFAFPQLEGLHVVEASSSRSGQELVVLHGDQTGEELLEQALRLLDPALLELRIEVRHFDLSLVNRRKTRNEVVQEAAQSLIATGFGVKAATVTPEGKTVPAPGTVEAFQKYLELAPDGKYAAQAKSMIEALSQTVETKFKAEKEKPAKKK